MRYFCGTCALALLLTGCVTTQEQQLAADAARCRSYGAAPGTQAHLQCRMELDRQRQAGALAAAQRAQMIAIGAQMMQPTPAPAPALSPSFTCRHYGNRTTCD